MQCAGLSAVTAVQTSKEAKLKQRSRMRRPLKENRANDLIDQQAAEETMGSLLALAQDIRDLTLWCYWKA